MTRHRATAANVRSDPATALAQTLRRFMLIRARTIHLKRALAGHDDVHAAIQGLYEAWPNKQWAVSRDSMSKTVDLLADRTVVLECGSGLSTLVLAACTEANGARLISLEHDRTWHIRMAFLLALCGFDPRTVHHAPLKSYDTYDWYATPAAALKLLDGSTAQCVFVDGPPGCTRGGRFGAMPELRRHLKPGALVVLDDVDRPGEQLAERCWTRDHALIRRQEFGPASHLTAVLEKTARSGVANAQGREAGSGRGAPLVSVIIPTRNRPRLTAEAVESVINQHYEPLEIIVVDDASDEEHAHDLRARIAPFKQVRLLRQDAQVGAQPSREAGLRHARGELIAILDSDDLWRSEKLAAQVSLLQAHEWLDVVLTGHQWLSADGRVRAPSFPDLSSVLPTKNMSTPLFRRNSLVAAGGFQPQGQPPYPTGEGLAFFLRVSGPMTFGLCPQVVVTCRDHDGPRNSSQFSTMAGVNSFRRLIEEHDSLLRRDGRVRAQLLIRLAARQFHQRMFIAGCRSLTKAVGSCPTPVLLSRVAKVFLFGLKLSFQLRRPDLDSGRHAW